MTLYFKKIETPIKGIVAVASNKGLYALIFERNWDNYQTKLIERNGDILKNQTCSQIETCRTQLNEYFQGQRKNFDLSLDLQGTNFQIQTWKSLCEIPYGQTWTYQQQAIFLNNSKATRAVGRTNGLNPISIIVPCHRVIGKSGKLTGYAGGLDIKEFLLNHENKYKY